MTSLSCVAFFLFSHKPRKNCEMSINIMNNRRILQLPFLQTYLCTIQSTLQLIELSYCLFFGKREKMHYNISIIRESIRRSKYENVMIKHLSTL